MAPLALICCPWVSLTFAGLAVWDLPAFTKNRERVQDGDRGNRFMETRPTHSDGRPLLSDEQFPVGGTHDS